MHLVPADLGPVNPRVHDWAYALPLLALCYLLLRRVLRRAEGAEVPEAYEAYEATGPSREQSTALPEAARVEERRERGAVITAGQARVEAERASAEAELRCQVAEVASELASRSVDDPLPAVAPPPVP
ncbi:hypothetical protein [Streptomyces sp. NPDC059009]|uniref:hypothetical protein n=1 Tax=Streptomyces sp. NPDC059009 TaxID=3346694 RepID=UPI00367F04BF